MLYQPKNCSSIWCVCLSQKGIFRYAMMIPCYTISLLAVLQACMERNLCLSSPGPTGKHLTLPPQNQLTAICHTGGAICCRHRQENVQTCSDTSGGPEHTTRPLVSCHRPHEERSQSTGRSCHTVMHGSSTSPSCSRVQHLTLPS
jgi:hypothetical protein